MLRYLILAAGIGAVTAGLHAHNDQLCAAGAVGTVVGFFLAVAGRGRA